MMSFLDAIACVISRTTHALDVITSISRYDRRSNLLHFFFSNQLYLFILKMSAVTSPSGSTYSFTSVWVILCYSMFPITFTHLVTFAINLFWGIACCIWGRSDWVSKHVRSLPQVRISLYWIIVYLLVYLCWIICKVSSRPHCFECQFFC